MKDIVLVELNAEEKQKAEELSSLAAEIWTEHYLPIIGLPQVEYMLKKYQSTEVILRDISTNGYRYFMAYYDGQLAGYCAAKPEVLSNSIFLSKLYVKKDYRGYGISRKMLGKLLEIAQENSMNHIWLTVNRHNGNSVSIYKKMGFKIVEEMVTDIGSGYVMDDYKMQLDI